MSTPTNPFNILTAVVIGRIKCSICSFLFTVGSKVRISIFFRVFRKNNIYGGYEDFVDILLGSSQNWTILSGNFYAF